MCLPPASCLHLPVFSLSALSAPRILSLPICTDHASGHPAENAIRHFAWHIGQGELWVLAFLSYSCPGKVDHQLSSHDSQGHMYNKTSISEICQERHHVLALKDGQEREAAVRTNTNMSRCLADIYKHHQLEGKIWYATKKLSKDVRNKQIEKQLVS